MCSSHPSASTLYLATTNLGVVRVYVLREPVAEIKMQQIKRYRKKNRAHRQRTYAAAYYPNASPRYSEDIVDKQTCSSNKCSYRGGHKLIEGLLVFPPPPTPPYGAKASAWVGLHGAPPACFDQCQWPSPPPGAARERRTGRSRGLSLPPPGKRGPAL